jgi:hypothetical protein
MLTLLCFCCAAARSCGARCSGGGTCRCIWVWGRGSMACGQTTPPSTSFVHLQPRCGRCVGSRKQDALMHAHPTGLQHVNTLSCTTCCNFAKQLTSYSRLHTSLPILSGRPLLRRRLARSATWVAGCQPSSTVLPRESCTIFTNESNFKHASISSFACKHRYYSLLCDSMLMCTCHSRHMPFLLQVRGEHDSLRAVLERGARQLHARNVHPSLAIERGMLPGRRRRL